MSAVSNNSLQGYLAVYAQESLQQYIAGMPNFNLFTKNFDTEIANGGLSVTTRISTTAWSTPNDLTQGWADTSASSSAVTATLKLRNYDIVFNELEWATITPQVLQNTYLPQMVKQLANGITVDALNNVTSSKFTNTITVASSSLFTVTGSTTSLQYGATLLSNLEIPEEGRYAIVTPNIHQSLVAGIMPTYIYGDDSAVKKNKVQSLIDFELIKYPRFYGASKPQGGASYSSGDRLVGILGHEAGLVAAVRAPIEINNALVQSANAVDPTSGLSIQIRWVYDISQPAYRMAVVSIYGTAAGNTSAIIPIITQSN